MCPVDTGLIALCDRSGKANVGHALETAVLHELQRRGAQVNYVHTEGGFEVDNPATDQFEGPPPQMLITTSSFGPKAVAKASLEKSVPLQGLRMLCRNVAVFL